MMPQVDYRIPKSLQGACDLLREAAGEARVVAGGTDLVIGLRNGDLKPAFLVDVTRVPELQGIEERNGRISIGAAVTHSEGISSPVMRRYGAVLCRAASEIGSPQIRNLGTIGGNIVNASPAADTIPPLMVLDAVAEVVSREGGREIALGELFIGPYRSALKPDEILARISFAKLPSEVRCGFVRLARREAMAIARMSVAVLLHIDGRSCVIHEARISVGAVTPTPCRMSDAETLLKGNKAGRTLFEEAARSVSDSVLQRSGIRASSSYKIPVVKALTVRALEMALEMA